MNRYEKGNVVRCTVTFRNELQVAADPDDIIFRYQKPDQSIHVLTFGADVAVVRDSAGVYHVDLPIDASGVWDYEFNGTGAVTADAADSFIVSKARVP